MLYPGSGDKAARTWSAVSGELLRTYEGHGGPVCCLQVVGDVLYSGSGDNTVRSVRFTGLHTRWCCLTPAAPNCVTSSPPRLSFVAHIA